MGIKYMMWLKVRCCCVEALLKSRIFTDKPWFTLNKANDLSWILNLNNAYELFHIGMIF